MQTRQNGTNECMTHYIELERMVSYIFFFFDSLSACNFELKELHVILWVIYSSHESCVNLVYLKIYSAKFLQSYIPVLSLWFLM